jgi:molybdopterin molybdotransferase
MSQTPEFFNVQPVSAAVELLFSRWNPQPQSEQLDPRQALGRILAVEAVSPMDLPSFPRSAMDGYAVRAQDTFGASQSLPAYLTVAGTASMGTETKLVLQPQQAVEIATGAMLPPGADAVVMVERTQALGEGEIEVLAPVAPGENVVQVGEDVTRGGIILPAGSRIRPQDIGGLLAVGVLSVTVTIPPRVGILSGGEELVTPEETPAAGQIRDINAYMLAGLVQQLGGEPILLGIARDAYEDYYGKAQAAFSQVDVLVMTAGSSISTRDLTRQVISGLGTPGILQHGLAVKPGKPTILAICDNKPVIGLPGNPVSALLVAYQILTPILRRYLGEKPTAPAMIPAILTSNIASQSGREDTVPVRLFELNGQWMAEPIFGKSNLIYTLVNADGLVTVPLNSNGFRAGMIVNVLLF